MLNNELINKLSSIKNVECPFCGYSLPIIYDYDTNVSNLLVTCKGRQCKQSFILNIKQGVQQNASVSAEVIEAFKLVFGNDWLEHLTAKYGDNFRVV